MYYKEKPKSNTGMILTMYKEKPKSNTGVILTLYFLAFPSC